MKANDATIRQLQRTNIFIGNFDQVKVLWVCDLMLSWCLGQKFEVVGINMEN